VDLDMAMLSHYRHVLNTSFSGSKKAVVAQAGLSLAMSVL